VPAYPGCPGKKATHTNDNTAPTKLVTNNTNWKHSEELKWPSLTACVLSVHETWNIVSTKQLRKNYHQQHSPTQQQTLTMNTSAINTAHTPKHKS